MIREIKFLSKAHRMFAYFDLKLFLLIFLINVVYSMTLHNKHAYFMDNSGSETEIADFMSFKSYVPNEQDLPKTSVNKNVVNDATYLLSKLSDNQLIKLLNDQPTKKEFALNDIIKMAIDEKSNEANKFITEVGHSNTYDTLNNVFENDNQYKKRIRTAEQKDRTETPYYRLENKEVKQPQGKNDAKYVALQKLNNLLNNPPPIRLEDLSEEDDEKKELLFDVLVAQLKALCCKKSTKKRNKQYQFLNQFSPQSFKSESYMSNLKSAQMTIGKTTNEFMFLIINDEIKSNGSNELISVDPESLEKNSSVLLLGPITNPLSDSQLKIVMKRISTELSKPQYIPLLQQLTEGSISSNKAHLMTSIMRGPHTRRYIKPHRCNHQSKLARIYGGPKWLLCTGYLNLNTPSLYD